MTKPTTGAEEMQCKELIQLVTEYLEGTIADAERQRIEVHMGECEWCERYIEQTQATIAALGQIDENTGDPEAFAQALAAFRASRRDV